jgi:hypothetical protein
MGCKKKLIAEPAELIWLYDIIYIYIHRVDLKVHVGIRHYEARRCYNMRPRESFFWVPESKLLLAKNLANIYFYEVVYQNLSYYI